MDPIAVACGLFTGSTTSESFGWAMSRACRGGRKWDRTCCWQCSRTTATANAEHLIYHNWPQAHIRCHRPRRSGVSSETRAEGSNKAEKATRESKMAVKSDLDLGINHNQSFSGDMAHVVQRMSKLSKTPAALFQASTTTSKLRSEEQRLRCVPLTFNATVLSENERYQCDQSTNMWEKDEKRWKKDITQYTQYIAIQYPIDVWLHYTLQTL